MKKQYKLLVVFVAVVLVLCCCCIPVSAATHNWTPSDINHCNSDFTASIVYDADANEYSVAPKNVATGNVSTPNEWWFANYVYNLGGVSASIDVSLNVALPLGEVPITKGQRVYLSIPAKFAFGTHTLKHEYDSFSVNIRVKDSDGYYWCPWGVVGDNSAIVYDTSLGYMVSDVFVIDEIAQDDYTIVGITFLFSRKSNPWQNASWGFGINSPVNFVYGDPDDIALQQKIDDLTAEQEKTNELLGDITADKYEPPKGGSDVDDYKAAEGQLMDSAQEGLDEASFLFSNINVGQFGTALLGVISIVNVFIDGMPWLSEIIIFALALGLFGFLFNIAWTAVRSGRSGGYKTERFSDHKKKGG